jgi:NAD-dependent DNA ligase
MTQTKLKTFLDNASSAYYAGCPIISDEVFDRLAESIGYNLVGHTTSSKVAHAYPMFSLQKHYEDQGKSPLVGVANVSISIKLDGAAISLLFIDGKFARGLTRGDGVHGVDITDKLQATELFPKDISANGIVQITGEIVAPMHVENSRNYAAGALNLKDINEFKTRAISFIAHGIQPYLNSTYDSDMFQLSSWGFSTVKDENLDKVYPSDGLVYRVNSNIAAEEMGYTSKFPKFAYALKERQDTVETTLLDVIWQVNKTGRVTPVAILEPVKIGDKNITRATLNNIGFIDALNLELGDTVAVRMAGMIIPEICYKVNV